MSRARNSLSAMLLALLLVGCDLAKTENQCGTATWNATWRDQPTVYLALHLDSNEARALVREAFARAGFSEPQFTPDNLIVGHGQIRVRAAYQNVESVPVWREPWHAIKTPEDIVLSAEESAAFDRESNYLSRRYGFVFYHSSPDPETSTYVLFGGGSTARPRGAAEGVLEVAQDSAVVSGECFVLMSTDSASEMAQVQECIVRLLGGIAYEASDHHTDSGTMPARALQCLQRLYKPR